jgi:hypothetical protein
LASIRRACERASGLEAAHEALAIRFDRLDPAVSLDRERLHDGKQVLDPVAQLARQQLAILLGALAIPDLYAVLDYSAIVQVRAGEQHPRARAVLKEAFLLVGSQVACGLQLSHLLFAGFDPLRRSHLAPSQLAGFDLAAGIAGHPQEHAVCVHDTALLVKEQHADCFGLQDFAQPLLAGSYGRLGALAFGEVDHADQDQRRTVERPGVD